MNFPDPSSTARSRPVQARAPERRSRRRRRSYLNIPRDAEGRAALLTALAHRAYPTYELFVYSLLAGAIMGLGYVLDSQALLVFGALVAPLLLPWAGLHLATVTGSIRFFFETLVALLLSAALVFLTGLLSGFAARAIMPHTFNEAFMHSRLWWPDLLLLALGAVILVVSFVRSESKPFLPSVILAYELFLPLSAGAFGLGTGLTELWPYGVLVFCVHFAWASLLGLFTLVILRIMPSSFEAFVFSAALAFVYLAVVVVLMNGNAPAAALNTQSFLPNPASGQSANVLPPLGESTPTAPAISPTAPPDTPTAVVTQFDTPVPATQVPTQPPGATPTMTLTLEPTPIFAMVSASKGGGAALRETPGGKIIVVLDNFIYVELLPETDVVSGYKWDHVIYTLNGIRLNGWVAEAYLVTNTPSPGPADTPSAIPTS
jgi:hypothetical protein